MTKLLLCTASIFALAGYASADDEMMSSGWGGFYVGLSAGQGDGYQVYANTLDYDLDGDVKGIYAGYNYDMAPYVFGVEIAYTKGPIIEHEIGGTTEWPEYNFEDFIDVKGRAGYQFGDFLLYGVLGYTKADWDQDGTFVDADGPAFGVGVEYLVTENIIVGAEYIQRDLEQRGSIVQDFDADIDTLQIRLACKF